MFEQVLSLLTDQPTSLVFHFLVLFSVEAALAMAFGQWLREREQGTARLTVALLVIGLARAALVAVALLTAQGLLARNLVLPPVERSVDTLTALALMWVFITMDDPIVLRRNTPPDVVAGIGLLLILGGSVYSAMQWFRVAGSGVAYNTVLQDFAWGAAQIGILGLGLLWMLLRIRYVYDAFLKAAIFILFGAAAALHLALPPLGDIPAATRLGLVVTMPTLAAVTFRHVVDRLLAFDVFHSTVGQPLEMPDAVVDAIRELPGTPEPDEAVPSTPEPEAPGEDALEDSHEDILGGIEDDTGEDTVPSPTFAIETATEPSIDGGGDEEALAELPAELQREYPNAVHIVESLEGLVDSLDVHDAANHVCRAVAMALRADVASIISLDEDQELGVVVAAYDNIAQTYLEGGTLDLSEQPTVVNVMGRLRQMRLTPQRNMRELRNLYKVLEITHTGPAYMQPLHADEHRLGVLMVGSPYAKVPLTNAERTLLDRFGRLVTVALMNATAYYDAVEKNTKVMSEAEERAEAVKARADVLEMELQDVRTESGQMQAYIDDLERQVVLAREESQQEIAKVQQAAHQEIANAQQAAQKHVEEIKQSTQKEDTERVADLERELEQARNSAQVELAALRMRLTSATVTQQEVAMLQEQLMGKAREVINLQTRLTEAQAMTEAVRQQLLSQMENMSDRREVERLEGMVERQEKDIKDLQTKLDEEREQAGMEFEALKKQVELEAVDRDTVANLQAELVERNALVDALQAQLTDRTRALTSLQANVGNVDDALNVLQERLNARNDEVNTLQAELQRVQEQAQQRIRQLQEQLEAQAVSQNGADTALIDQLKSDLSDRVAEVERLEAQLAQAKQATGSLETQLAATTAAVETAISESRKIDAHEEVIASIAQELRTPMSSIMGYTDLLLGESVGIIGALQRKFLQRVKANTERMTALLDNLVSITALDSGQFQLEPEKVDVTEVVEEAISGTVSQFQEKNITLRLQINDRLPLITADKDAVHQIVTHLLTNASLASPVEGEVMLVAHEAKGTVPGPHGDGLETDVVQISVTDTGPGINPEDQERVFMRKYRADNPLIEGLGDTGVALSIAKTLVDTHGGHIWLDSEQNLGTTFHVLLPVARVTAPAGAEQRG